MGFKTVLLNPLIVLIRLLLLVVVIEVLSGIWGNINIIFGNYITSHPFSRIGYKIEIQLNTLV
jgi:hypothetical protein